MPRRPLFHGWKVVATAFLVAMFGWGLGFYGSGVYLATLAQTRGWSTGTVGAAVTGYYLLGAVMLTTVPRLIARFGERQVLLAGSAAMGAAVVALTRTTEIWQLWPAFLAMSLGWATMSGVMVNALVAPWFDRRLGIAISLALNGASCGGVIVAPLMILAVDRLGFTLGVGLVVLAMVATLWPAAMLYLGTTPARLGLAPDGGAAAPGRHGCGTTRPATSTGELLRIRSLWTVLLSSAIGLFAQVGVLTHQVAFLSPRLTPEVLSLAVGLTTGAAIVGRVGTGLVVDRIDPRLAMAATLGVQAAALAALATLPGPLTTLAACTAFGLGVGNLITLPSLILRREVGAGAFTQAVGLVMAGSQFTYAFAPLGIGHLRDVAGDYSMAWFVCAALDLTAAAAALFARAPAPPRP
ncbi:MFS transporter [Thalassobaculum fulvum]|uniref:MFS transporter n=1 Tax=Thalassobaculum fulvum TaxID=1633335 RepID=A0A918XXS7_9PROT|nr:MFS transporter [Thalassobaculum fulvum]GHD63464.1 MFS transporter [Thalassobaculum fulvum]